MKIIPGAAECQVGTAKAAIILSALCLVSVVAGATELSDKASQTGPGEWTEIDVGWRCSNDYARACSATGSVAENPQHASDCPGSDPRGPSGKAYCINPYYLMSGWDSVRQANPEMEQSNYRVTNCATTMGAAGLLVGSYAPHIWWNPVTKELYSYQSNHGAGQGGDDIFIYREKTNDFKSQLRQPNDTGDHPTGTYHDSEYTWRPDGDYECDVGDYGNVTHGYDQVAIGFPQGSTKGRLLFNNGSNYIEEWNLDSQTWNLSRRKPEVYPRITPMLWWWPEHNAFFFAQFLDKNGDKWCEVYKNNYEANSWTEYRNSKTSPLWHCGEWHNFAIYDDFHGWIWMGGGDYSNNTPSQQYFHILKPDGTSVDNLRFPTSVGRVGTGENQAHVIIDPASGKLLLWNAGLEFWEYDHEGGQTWTKLCDGADKINGQDCLPGYEMPPFLFAGSPQGSIEGAQFAAIPEHGVIFAWDFTGLNATQMTWVYRHTPSTPVTPPGAPNALRIP